MTSEPRIDVITGRLHVRGKRPKSRRARSSQNGTGLDSGSQFVEPVLARIPRVSRLMALAIRCEELIESGVIANRAILARLGGVSRARVTQIMNLRNLAPEIQETLLFLTVERGRAPVLLADLQPIARELSWERQRGMWKSLWGQSQKDFTNNVSPETIS